MKYLNSIFIEQYKGIKNLKIEEFAEINLIIGPNSSGKTALTEAIQILLNPADFEHYVRATGNTPSSLANSFYKDSASLHTYIEGTLLAQKYFTNIISYAPMTSGNFHGHHYYGYPLNGTETVSGKEISFSFLETKQKLTPSLVEFTCVTEQNSEISLQKISEDSVVKERVLSFLSLFDENYLDFEKNEFHHTIISHKTLGALNADFFRGGIRRFLSIAEKLSGFKNGILIIDPLEYQLAYNSFEEVTRFIFSLCRERQIQLFIVTYSDEIIDEWLDLLQFHNQLNQLAIFRLQSNAGNTNVKKFDGNLAYRLRLEQETDFRTCELF